MEVFLNVLWFAIAVGSLVAYFQLIPTNRRTMSRDLLALVCLSILLLPVISITDDLNFETFVSEDFNVTKRLVSGIVRPPLSTILDSFTISLPKVNAMFREASWRAMDAVVQACPGPPYLRVIFVRPPPFLHA